MPRTQPPTEQCEILTSPPHRVRATGRCPPRRPCVGLPPALQSRLRFFFFFNDPPPPEISPLPLPDPLPILTLLTRIKGAITGAPAQPRPCILSDTEMEAPPSDERSRQRGTRGGRGRGGRDTASSQNGPASAGNNRGAPQPTRNDDERRGRPSRRQRPSRDTPHAPVPEDVALRPA